MEGCIRYLADSLRGFQSNSENVHESRCIFVQEDLHNVRNNPEEIAHVLDKSCRFFVQRGASKAEEIKDLDVLDYDDDVYVSLCDWSGYDTTEITSEESEDENNGALEQNLVEGEEVAKEQATARKKARLYY